MCPRAHGCPASVVDVIHSAESFHVAKATKQPTLGTGRFSQFLLRPALIVDLCTNLAQANARSAATSPVTGCARRASCWTPSIAARLASPSATSPPRMSPSLAQRWCPSREYSPRRRRVSMAVPQAPVRHQLHQPHPSRRRGSRHAPHSIQIHVHFFGNFAETMHDAGWDPHPCECEANFSLMYTHLLPSKYATSTVMSSLVACRLSHRARAIRVSFWAACRGDLQSAMMPTASLVAIMSQICPR